MTNKNRKKRGRPSKLDANEKNKIIRLAKFGLTDDQISEGLGFTKQTLNNYKKKDPAFFDSLKRSKEISDELVEKALFKRALGYSFVEEYATKDGAVACEKVSHPDVTACIFWLKNRKSKEWKDKHDHDLGDDVNAAAGSIAKLFRKRYDSEAKRLAAGEDPALVLFGRAAGSNGHVNGASANGH